MGLSLGQPLSYASTALALTKGGGYSVAGLPLWSAAVRAMQAGSRNARLLLVGDSTVAGEGSTGNGRNSNAKSASWPTRLGVGLAARGFPVTQASVLATNNMGPNLDQYDTRNTYGTGWVIAAGGLNTLAGPFLRCTGAGIWTFTPTEIFDTIELSYARAPSNGTITVGVDGGAALATINSAGTSALLTQTISCARGTHAINTAKTGGEVYPAFIRCRDSTTRQIEVMNAGWASSKAADWVVTTDPWNAYNCISVIAPDLTIISLTINDWTVATTRATYRANLTTLISKAKETGDVLLLTGAPSNPGASYVTQQAYIDDNVTVASATSIPAPLLATEVFGSTYSASLMFDGLHPNGTGYQGLADLVRARIAP